MVRIDDVMQVPDQLASGAPGYERRQHEGLLRICIQHVIAGGAAGEFYRNARQTAEQRRGGEEIAVPPNAGQACAPARDRDIQPARGQGRLERAGLEQECVRAGPRNNSVEQDQLGPRDHAAIIDEQDTRPRDTTD